MSVYCFGGLMVSTQFSFDKCWRLVIMIVWTKGLFFCVLWFIDIIHIFVFIVCVAQLFFFGTIRIIHVFMFVMFSYSWILLLILITNTNNINRRGVICRICAAAHIRGSTGSKCFRPRRYKLTSAVAQGITFFSPHEKWGAKAFHSRAVFYGAEW